MVLERTPPPAATAITALPTSAPLTAPASTPKAAAWRRRLPDLAHGFILGMLLLLAFLLASFAIRNSDVYLRLATGRLIAQGEYQFGVDPFSFTTETVYWANPSWLYDLLAYLIYQVAGGPGLVLAKAALMAGLAWLLLSFRRPEQPMFLPVLVCALAIVVMSPRFLLQPMCVSLFFLGMSLYILERSKQIERRLWWLPPLFLLWANIDGWFILGLLLLAAYLIGACIEGVEKQRRKRLGLALLMSIVCCLINPHLWHVFALPPELAYLAAQLSDAIGVGPPEWMMASGRTWQVLRDNDAAFLLTLSPLAEIFRSLPGLGNNLSGKAYFVLLLIGLLSFIPQLFLSTESWRKRSWSLLAVWLPPAALSLFLARLIGFFAVVTAAIVILNIQGYLAARAARGKPLPRPSLLGDGVAAVVLAILLLLAWPGWINGPLDNFNSARRVAWSLEPDESFRGAAERLNKLHGEGKARGGAALSLELANFLPWFAPGVKSYCDSRYELFSGVIEDFYRIRRVLSRDALEYFTGKAPPLEIQFAEWRRLADRHELDFVALTNFQGAEVTQQLTQRFWLEPGLWPFLYGDGRTLIFGWNPEQPDRFAGERIDWNAAAFGKVPDDRRPPAQGSVPPDEAEFLDRFLRGLPPPPLEVAEVQMYQGAYQFLGRVWVRAYFRAWQANALASTASMGAAIPAYLTAHPDVLPFLLPNQLVDRLAQSLRAEDNGPPAMPVLMVRAGRRGVAEAPRSAEGYQKLADACSTLWRMQENHWALDQGQERLDAVYMRSRAPHAVNFRNFRNMLRRVQVIAALKACLRVDPDNLRVHEILGETYREIYYLDVALDHFTELRSRLERRRPADPDPKVQDAFRANLEQLQNFTKGLDNGLKKRKADFDLRSGKSALDKYALALRLPYKAVELNKSQTDPAGMGLAKQALLALSSATLGQPEDFFIVANQLDILLLLGELRVVGDVLEKERARELLGPSAAYYQTLYAAAIGDYQQARDALTAQIEQFAISKLAADVRNRLVLNMATAHSLPGLLGQAHEFVSDRGVLGLARALYPAANLHLLRGLMALEQGDTTAALRDFQTCLDMTTTVFFPDRFIAQRYRDLLKAQR